MPQAPEPESHVLTQVVEPFAKSHAVLATLGRSLERPTRGRGVPEPTPCLAQRLLRRQPLGLELLGAQLQMQRDLLVHVLARDVGAPERQPEEPLHARTDHRGLPTIAR